MVIPTGKLGKVRIISFRDPKMLPTHTIGVMETLINPEGYNREYAIEYNEDKSTGESGSQQRFVGVTDETMEFRFVFDRTGIFPNSPPLPVGVTADIELFKQLTYKFIGDEHRTPFVTLIWGTLVFPCVLKSMNINYKLFHSNGTPIRAEIMATFSKFVDSELQKLIENRLSPDLTHLYEVKAGDTLPLIAHRIYGNAKYYLSIARINQLINFKVLKPGQQLMLPPLEK